MDDLSNLGLPPDIQQFATGMQASDLLERASNFASLLESMVLCRVIQLCGFHKYSQLLSESAVRCKGNPVSDFVNIFCYFQKVHSFAK